MDRDPQSPRQEGVTGASVPPGPGSPLTGAQLKRVKARDPDALAALFDHYFGRIYGLAFRMTGDKAAAEDVTQEVFLKVHRAAHQLDAGRDPGPWLMTITANLCKERWRSRSGRQEKQTFSLDATPDAVANVPAVGADPETEVLAGDRARSLEQAIGRLPEAMRLVVVLHDMQGLTHEEISEVTGDAPPAVRKRYSRALMKLREMLQDVLE